MARRRKSKFVFGTAPMLYHSRSQFDLSFSHKTSFSAGKLIPVYCQEILPGDTFNCQANVVARVTSSFLKPVMDNAFLDMYFFFVPNRLVFDRWEEVFGENRQSAWAQSEPVSAPLISNSVSPAPGNLADYFGIPLPAQSNISSFPISVLPFRAYAKIWDDWFRDENLQDPMNIQTGEWNSVSEVLSNANWGPGSYTGMPAPINRLHDYFSQVLPSPQKGSPVNIGAAVFPETSVPVTTSVSDHSMPYAMNWSVLGGPGSFPSSGYFGVGAFSSNSGATNASASLGSVESIGSRVSIAPSNLVANIGETQLGSVDVNDLRFAFQLQKMLERDARSGSRYREYLRSAFGVVSPDARLQVSEFLGGKRIPLSVFQATQTSQATSDSPLGNVAGFSLSNGRARWSKSFTEHGFVIGVAAVRYFHSYQQGIDRFWFRSNRTDFYDTIFANIGEQPVWTKQLYAVNGVQSDTVFGYNPAWEEYRCHQNMISGQLRTSASQGFDIWHFADNYASQPILGNDWISETPSNIDRTLSVPSTTADQFIFDFYFKQRAVRVMPTYSVPGLIDHH